MNEVAIMTTVPLKQGGGDVVSYII